MLHFVIFNVNQQRLIWDKKKETQYSLVFTAFPPFYLKLNSIRYDTKVFCSVYRVYVQSVTTKRNKNALPLNWRAPGLYSKSRRIFLLPLNLLYVFWKSLANGPRAQMKATYQIRYKITEKVFRCIVTSNNSFQWMARSDIFVVVRVLSTVSLFIALFCSPFWLEHSTIIDKTNRSLSLICQHIFFCFVHV